MRCINFTPMTVQVAIISKHENFCFAAQYSRGAAPREIDPMTQLYFYSLLDELYIKIAKQQETDAQDYFFPNFSTNSQFRVSVFQTFSGHFIFLSVAEELPVLEEQLKLLFFQIHKAYAAELMNPFYVDGAPGANEQLLGDIQTAINAHIFK